MNAQERVNILLVDDQQAKLLSHEAILAGIGENLLKATSASQAFECLLKNEIALVLIDVCMPDLDGFELAAMIREHPRFETTAIIFVSAIMMTYPDQLRGYQLGGVDYVPVPVVPELLRAKVKVFVDLYRKTRQLERFNAELEKRVAERTSELQRFNEQLELRIKERTHERESALAQLFEALSPAKRIAHLRRELAGKIVFTTSFGLEDQAILHLIAERGSDIEIVTLDTGRLFPETYALWAQTERRYGLRIRAVYPRQDDLEALIERQGIDGFYESRAARTACCHVRKIEPLDRALGGARGWIAGLRAEQSAHRRDMALVTAERGLIKLNPIFDWTREKLRDFVVANNIPVNPLHAKGFASIGCAPCTRPIAPGEPERAGRWWWEDEEKKECGLHVNRV